MTEEMVTRMMNAPMSADEGAEWDRVFNRYFAQGCDALVSSYYANQAHKVRRAEKVVATAIEMGWVTQ